MITLNNNINIPQLGLGTFNLNGESCINAVCEAIKAGYRMIDTAEAYKNEKSVGHGIIKSGINREELFIVTKVNFKSYNNTRKSVIASLKNLKTDYLDLVLLHWPFGDYYTAWRELEKLYEEGIIKAIGVSNFEPDRMIDLINFNKITPVINQIETHLFCQQQIEHEWMEKYRVNHMAYAPLGQGKKNEMFKLPEILNLSQKYKKTPAQILLRFLTQKDIIVIPKSVNIERIKENIDIFNFKLTQKELNTLTNFDTKTKIIGNSETPELVEISMNW